MKDAAPTNDVRGVDELDHTHTHTHTHGRSHCRAQEHRSWLAIVLQYRADLGSFLVLTNLERLISQGDWIVLQKSVKLENLVQQIQFGRFMSVQSWKIMLKADSRLFSPGTPGKVGSTW